MHSIPAQPRTSGSLAKTLVFAAFCLLLALFLWKAVRPDLAPKRLAEVIPGKVYRSGELSPQALADLAKSTNLKTIIDLGIAPDGDPRDRRQQLAAQALNITRYKFNLVGDSTGNPNEYLAALRLALDPANQPVLIHCATGSQRTSCAIALVRMAEGSSADQALTEAHAFDAKPKVDEVLRSVAPGILDALKNGAQIAGHEAVTPKPVEPISARP